MKPYLLNSTQNDSQPLPALKDSTGYSVDQGNPGVSIRMDSGTANSRSRLGIWMCTPGSFTATEKGDELQTIIEGKLTLITADGSSQQFGPGDSFYTEKGERLTWKITETVKKVFFTYDRDVIA